MMMQFFMPMVPPTATGQEHKVAVVNGRPVYYDPQNLKDAKAKMTAHLAKHKPEKPMEGAVRIFVKWCFPCGEKHAPGSWHTEKPDTDNLIKAFKDCMTKLRFWKDDSQVASEINEKFWSDVPGIWVRVEQLHE